MRRLRRLAWGALSCTLSCAPGGHPPAQPTSSLPAEPVAPPPSEPAPDEPSASCETSPVPPLPSSALPLDTAISVASGTVRLRQDCGKPLGLAFANGSDISQQPVTLFTYGKGSGTGDSPAWFSKDYGYHSGLCAGDVDGDGFDDLVVTVVAGRRGAMYEGGVKIYYSTPTCPSRSEDNDKVPLSNEPVWVARGVAAIDCAVLDVDGSGRADVLVATAWDAVVEPSSTDGAARAQLVSVPPFQQRGGLRVLVDPGRPARPLSLEAFGEPPAPWCPGTRFAPGALRSADVDGDGRLDIVAGGSQVAVWYGRADAAGKTVYGAAPDWVSDERYSFVPSLEVAVLPQLGRPVLVATRSCFGVQQGCCGQAGPSGIYVYDPAGPERSTKSLWAYELGAADFAASAQLVPDAKAGKADLLMALFREPGRPDSAGAALRRFGGTKEPAAPFVASPVLWSAGYVSVVAELQSIHLFDNEPCDDLVAVSTNPAAPSLIFRQEGGCNNR